MAVSAVIQALAAFPPGTTTVDWDAVAAGKVARWAGTGEERVAGGVAIFRTSREAAWLGITDDHPTEPVAGLTEIPLRGAWASDKLLYQHLDLPWPFEDRHWAIDIRNNTSLAERSGVWERSWRLEASALEQARSHMPASLFDVSLLTPVNEGSWLLIPLDATSTLVFYQTRVKLGGMVPDGAVHTWAMATLDEVFAKYQQNAATIPSRYGAGCTAQPGADRKPIPCFP